jgi:branched-chain amino acid transport system substrate-binding protein
MGRQAEAALRLFVADANARGGISIAGRNCRIALECLDDRSDSVRAAEIYRWLCFERRADLIFGPYSSRLARVAAPIAEGAGMVMVNHGGASDELCEHNHRLIVSVLSPASDYLVPLARLLATLKFWRKRVAIVASRTPFARDVAGGFERACNERRARLRGVRVRLKYSANGPDRAWERLLPALRRSRINALVGVGSFDEDVELMRVVTSRDLDISVLGCVAAGVADFGAALGEHAEGIVGPSGWEEEAEITPDLGPTPENFARRMRAAYPALQIDYPAAQAYAAGLLAAAALEAAGAIDQRRLRAAFSDLRVRTLYGDFAIDRVTGRQIGHKILLVQWHRGRKVVIGPEALTEQGAIELPSGWRLILASFQQIRLGYRGGLEDPRDGDDEGD